MSVSPFNPTISIGAPGSQSVLFDAWNFAPGTPIEFKVCLTVAGQKAFLPSAVWRFEGISQFGSGTGVTASLIYDNTIADGRAAYAFLAPTQAKVEIVCKYGAGQPETLEVKLTP